MEIPSEGADVSIIQSKNPHCLDEVTAMRHVAVEVAIKRSPVSPQLAEVLQEGIGSRVCHSD